MRFTQIVFGVCLIGLSTSAAAAEWWRVSTGGSGSDETIAFIDQSSVRTAQPGTYQAWSLWISEKLSSTGVRKYRSLDRYNCADRSKVTLSQTTLGNSDRVISTRTFPTYSQEVTYVAPDTMAESALEFVCNGPKEYQILISPLSPDAYAGRWFKL